MAVDPDRRAALAALGSLGTLLAGGCLAAGTDPVPPEALESRFTAVGETDGGDLRVAVAVRNPTDRPVEATLYVQAVVPDATETAARYLELSPGERATRAFVFPVAHDRFLDGGWLRIQLTTGGA
jgi:hypothetical protein